MERWEIDLLRPAALDDTSLDAAIEVLSTERRRRRIEAADPDALTDAAFASAFRSDGLPQDPYTVNGVLVCPGGKVDKSALAHVCAFVRIGDRWVWESPFKISDQVRHLPGPRTRMQSVTVLSVPEGEAVDLITCRARNGVHELTGVRSFIMGATDLEMVSARAVKPAHHR